MGIGLGRVGVNKTSQVEISGQLWPVGLARDVDGAYHLPWRECGRKEPCANINRRSASPWRASLEPALRMVSLRYKCDCITFQYFII